MSQPNALVDVVAENVAFEVRRFEVREGISQLFEIEIEAVSTRSDIDLEAIVGFGAALRLAVADETRDASGCDYVEGHRVWGGICSEAEHLSTADNGLSTYRLRIEPMLWRTTQRHSRRIFQNANESEIVSALLREWGIEPRLDLRRSAQGAAEYRVQLDESDYSFICRQLETCGISYLLNYKAPRDGEVASLEDGYLAQMELLLSDSPETTRRRESALDYIGDVAEKTNHKAWASQLRLGRRARPGHVSLRGYDYRAGRALKLSVQARTGNAAEQRHESYRYDPGAFLRARGSDDKHGQRMAEVQLEAERSAARRVTMKSNVIDLPPGTVFSVHGHPRSELATDGGLLLVEARIRGEVNAEWEVELEAVPLTKDERAYCPPLTTEKPRVMGVQSALVVGPRGQEIHTDEHGRVKVQFHWDRLAAGDDTSSCWIRVSQAWAGNGYGMMQLPRVGDEVVVGFYDGDPDRPVVVGRVHNREQAFPAALPRGKTKTVWRTRSTPDGEGYNELSFEDAKGAELVHLRAEKDLQKTIVANESNAVGGNRETTIRGNESRRVGGSQQLEVSGDRALSVTGSFGASASQGLSFTSGRMGIAVDDGRIVISNGTASIVLDGPHIYVDAEANIHLRAGALTKVSGQAVEVDANVKVDETEPLPPRVMPLVAVKSQQVRDGESDMVPRAGTAVRPRAERVERPGAESEPELKSRELYGKLRKGLDKLPPGIQLPAAVDEQLEHAANVAMKGEKVYIQVADPETYEAMRKRAEDKLEAERRRVEALGREAHGIFERQREHVENLGDELEARVEREKGIFEGFGEDWEAIWDGDHGGFVDTMKAVGKSLKEQVKHVLQLKRDVLAMIERERAWITSAVREWKGYGAKVQEYVESMVELVKNPKDAVLDVLFGEDKELAKDIASLAEEFGLGDEAADLFNLGSGAGGATPDPSVAGGLGESISRPTQMGTMHGGVDLSAPSRTRVTDMGLSHGGLNSDAISQAAGNPIVGTQGSQAAAKGWGNSLYKPPTEVIAQGYVNTPKMTNYSGAMPQNAPSGTQLSGQAAKHANSVATSGSLSRPGAVAPQDVAHALQHGPMGFLQTPHDGQMMVVRSAAGQVDTAALQQAVVQAQMDGLPANQAMVQALEQQGHAVYQRPWGDWSGPLSRAAASAAAE